MVKLLHELGNKLESPVQDNTSWKSTELPDVMEEKSCCFIGHDCGMHGDKVGLFGHRVYHHHDGIEAL